MKFLSAEGVTLTVLTNADVPPIDGAANATLTFTINTQGETENYQISGTLSPAGQRLVFESLRNWKFRPALRDGIAVPVRAETSFTVK